MLSGLGRAGFSPKHLKDLTNIWVNAIKVRTNIVSKSLIVSTISTFSYRPTGEIREVIREGLPKEQVVFLERNIRQQAEYNRRLAKSTG